MTILCEYGGIEYPFPYFCAKICGDLSKHNCRYDAVFRKDEKVF